MGYENWVVRCVGCGKRPEQIPEYRDCVREEPESFKNPLDAVIKDEGTYDPSTKLFLCTDCYIKLGTPSNATIFHSFKSVRSTMGNWTEDPIDADFEQ